MVDFHIFTILSVSYHLRLLLCDRFDPRDSAQENVVHSQLHRLHICPIKSPVSRKALCASVYTSRGVMIADVRDS